MYICTDLHKRTIDKLNLINLNIKPMKAIKFIAVLAALTFSMSAMCQTTAQLKSKQAKSVLKEKASKDARKEAKKMEKEGWKVSPGALPLEKQLDRAYMYALDIDEDMNQLYLLGEGKSVAGNYDAARMQATELARLEIARSISTEATSLIDNMVGNKQLDNEEAASMTTMLSESKTITSQKLGRVVVAVEAYRELPNKNREVLVRLAAKASDIKEIAKNAIREEMEKRGKQMSEKTMEMLNKK